MIARPKNAFVHVVSQGVRTPGQSEHCDSHPDAIEFHDQDSLTTGGIRITAFTLGKLRPQPRLFVACHRPVTIGSAARERKLNVKTSNLVNTPKTQAAT